MKSAVIYARYSSNSQTEQSIEGQLTVCQKYALDNGLQIVETYIDRAMTGTNDNRVAFQQMLADCEKNSKWEIVLVYALDRFGRNSTEVAVNKQRLRKNGKTLISATQRTSVNIDGSRNLDGILLENVYIGIAEYYSAELSEKILRGQRENRKKGFHCGGHIAYGYKSIDCKLYVDEYEAEAVRFIFDQYGHGVTVPKIIEQLTEKGYKHNGEPFLRSCIYSILRNEKYVGIYKYKGEIFTDIYPQIITPEVFAKVKAINEANKTGTRSIQAVYLLRGKLKCGYCGQPISAESGTSHNKEKKYYYKCHGRKKYKNGCTKTTLKKELLEEFVIEFILEELKRPENIENAVKTIMALQERYLNDNPSMNIFKKEKSQVETALNNLMRAIEAGIITATTQRRLQELEEQKTELERKILIEESKQAVLLDKEQIERFYIKTLVLNPERIISTLIKEIVLYNDKIEVYLNSPLRTSPDDNRGFSFYTEVVNMPIERYSVKGTTYKRITLQMLV